MTFIEEFIIFFKDYLFELFLVKRFEGEIVKITFLLIESIEKRLRTIDKEKLKIDSELKSEKSQK